MPLTIKLTKKAYEALEWFYNHEPVGWFDAHAPSDAMRRSLLRRGLIEELPRVDLQVIKYRCTALGCRSLR